MVKDVARESSPFMETGNMHRSYKNSDVVKVAVIAQTATTPQPVTSLQKALAVTLIGISLLGYWLG